MQLGADIDLLGAAYGGSADETLPTAAERYANVLEWVPIDQRDPHFDGLGHTIDHLYINAPDKDNQGLFGQAQGMDSGLYIQNVSIGSKSYVHGKENVGALAGITDKAAFTNCSNAAEVVGEGQYVSGIVGGWANGKILGCSNTGAVTGTTCVGGIASYGYFNMVNCFNTGAVTATAGYAGGVAAGTFEKIVNCYNAGPVAGDKAAAIVVYPPSSGTPCYNCLYVTEASKPATAGIYDKNDAHGKVEGVTAEALKSWGGAYQMNRVAASINSYNSLEYAAVTDFANMTTWRQATGEGATLENNGYPVLTGIDSIDANDAVADHMQKAADWSQVGAWVDTFLTADETNTLRVPGADSTAATPLNYKPNLSTNNGSDADLSHPAGYSRGLRVVCLQGEHGVHRCHHRCRCHYVRRGVREADRKHQPDGRPLRWLARNGQSSAA